MLKLSFVALILAGAVLVSAQSSNNVTVTCDVCEFFVAQFEALTDNNKTAHVLVEELEKACLDLSSSFSHVCYEFVKHNQKTIIQFLLHPIPSQTVCSFVGLCGNYGMSPCALCKDIVIAVEDNYGHSYSKDERILKNVLDLCESLPPNDATECENIANDLGPALISWVLSAPNATTSCVDFGVCQTQDEGCSSCEFIVKEVEAVGLTGSSAQDQKLLQYLLEVCAKLPTSEESKCEFDITNYGPVVVHALVNGANPETVCADLILCPSSPSSPSL